MKRPASWPDNISLDEFWLMLTLLSLPPRELEERLPGRIPRLKSPYLKNGDLNPLIAFVSVVSTRHQSWRDEFVHCEESMVKLIALVEGPDLIEKDWEKYSLEALYDSDWWNTAREIANQLLLCAGVGRVVPLSGKIDPTQFDEFPPSRFDCDYSLLDPAFDPAGKDS